MFRLSLTWKPVVPALFALALLSPVAAQAQEAGEPEPAAAPAPAERPKSGIWKGRHRFMVLGGAIQGDTVRDAGVLAAPLTGQPGALNFPATTPLRVDLDDASVVGLRYAYQFRDAWSVDLGIERLSSSLIDPEFDPVQMEADVRETSLTGVQQDELVARLNAHSASHDIDVTFLDIGLLRTFNRNSRFPVEIGGGIGYALSSTDDVLVYERLVRSDRILATDPILVANDVSDGVSGWLPFGQCQSDTDPCIEMTAQDGLTWHADGALGIVFNEAVQLNLGLRVRFVEQILDPGDSFMTTQATLGVRFLFGGR